MQDGTKTIGFLGLGNMAEALIRGLLQAGVAPDKIGGSGPREERMSEMAEKYGILATTDNVELVKRSDIVVVSVKPQIIDRVVREVANEMREGTTVISVAAGVPTSALEHLLRAETRVVRAMPNTPALVLAGATAIAPGEHATEADMDTARFLFDAVGMTVVIDEYQLDAVTGLSGSGPAYIFLMLDALADGGVKMGLSRRNAQRLAAQTVMGSAKLLLETNEHPGRLKDMVTSPGGTAIAGLATLEAGGMRTTLINAVEAATQRSRELGRAAVPHED